MPIEIRQIDAPSESQETLRAMAFFLDVMEREDRPDDPPTPWEARVAEWRHDWASYPAFRWLLEEDGDLVGYSLAAYDVTQNLENAFFRVQVLPTHRRRGHGRAIATPMLDHLTEVGRTRISTTIKQGHPAEAIAERAGLKSVYLEKRSRLVIADLDMGLMRNWIERAGERAGDYRLRYIEGPIPEDFIQDFCDLTFIMNSAPREDFEVDDEVMTPEDWRDREKGWETAGSHVLYYIAEHRETGDLAGYTSVLIQHLHPDLAMQMDTGVHPDHRNKGLGRWLKAAMIERVVDSYPDVQRIDTTNAGSNEPMLNINVAMGFKPVHLTNTWQGDLATARGRLGI